MKVDINLVKELRAITHAPLKDCTAALAEANGDVEQAQEVLKQKGILKAGKKADRETNHGVVKFITKDGVTVGVKVLCETDFVARNETFQGIVDGLLDMLVEADGEFDFDTISSELKDSLETKLKENVGTVGENLILAYTLRTTKKAYAYNHNGNTLAAVVYYESEEEVDEIAKEVALQIAAMNPTYISIDNVPAETKDKLVAEFTEELKDSNKPEDIIKTIIEGKVYKALQEDILLEQGSIRDGAKKVKDVIGSKMKVNDMLRVVVG